MMEFLPYIAGQITQPFNLVLMFGATVIGLIFGAIPGLSGTLAVMLFMPLTYTMNASSAVVFLIALWVGGCSGAFIGSVLLGIPGSASAVATCFDGYPMAQAGKAGKALAIGMVASFLGTFFSAILGALLSQKIADIAFALGPWEYFSLCFVAITMVLAISKGNMFKGLASASVGLLFASVGYSPIDAEPRFVFGNMYLMSGLGMTIVLIGIFGGIRQGIRRYAGRGHKVNQGPGNHVKGNKGSVCEHCPLLWHWPGNRFPSRHGIGTVQPCGLLQRQEWFQDA